MVAAISAMSFVILAAQASPAGASRISGRVTDASSGAPISGAAVTLVMVVEEPNGAIVGRGLAPRQSTTDASGAFAFEGVGPAQYNVGVEKTGFASYPDVLIGGLPERVTVDGKTALPPLEIALSKGAVMTGKIVSATEEPQADLSVTALRRTDQAVLPGLPEFVPNGQAKTNDLGEFRIAGLGAGDYIVLASLQSHGPFNAVSDVSTAAAPTYFPGTLDEHAARITSLAPGQTVDGLNFATKTVAVFHVSGVVVDAAGHPSPGAMVTLFSDWRASESLEPQMVMAADDGTFTIAGVIPGTYVIDATPNAGGGLGGGGMVTFTSETVIADSKTKATTITVAAADITGLKVVAQDR